MRSDSQCMVVNSSKSPKHPCLPCLTCQTLSFLVVHFSEHDLSLSPSTPFSSLYSPKMPSLPVLAAQSSGWFRRDWTVEELRYSPYGYQPVLSAPLVFTVLFSISACWHFGQNIAYRHWWLLVLTVGCLFEAAGNACRVYGHYRPFNAEVYTAMQAILTITPSLFAAVDFAIVGRLASVFPARCSLVSPRWIVPFFVALDVASMAIQGGGAGVAASAQSQRQDTTMGGNIVVVGLALQLVGYVIFGVLLYVFVRRCATDPSVVCTGLWDRRTRTFVGATAVSSALIFVRCLFRLIEMCVGWEGVIARTEWAFYAFDATLVTVAVYIFNVYNPAAYLARDVSWNSKQSRAADDDPDQVGEQELKPQDGPASPASTDQACCKQISLHADKHSTVISL